MVCIYTLNHTLIWVKGSRFNSGHIWPLCVETPFPLWTIHFRLNWLLMFQKPKGWILYSRRQSIRGKRVQVFYQQIKKLDQISLQLIAEKRKFKWQVWLLKAIRRRVPQRTVSGRHKWISRYPTGGLLHQKLRIRKGILLRLWQPYLWTDVSTVVRLAPDMRLSISCEHCFLIWTRESSQHDVAASCNVMQSPI